MKLHRFTALVTLVITLALIVVARILAQGCLPPAYNSQISPWAKGTTVNVSFDTTGSFVGDPTNPAPKFDLTTADVSSLTTGIQQWNSVNVADGTNVTFTTGGPGTSFPWIISTAWPKATITYKASNGQTYAWPVDATCSPQPCTDAVAATTYIPDRNAAGGFTGTAAAAITLINTNGTYTAANGIAYANWDPLGPNFATAMQYIGTHEAGHGFGLDDEPRTPPPVSAPTCGDVMSPWGPSSPSDPSAGTNDQGGCETGTITPCDSSEVENNPNNFYSPPVGGGGCCASLRDPKPKPKLQLVVNCGGGPGGCCSPIIIDVTGNGFYLTDAQNGVVFDITGSGKTIQIAWTAPGADNAFLCLPDSNGCNSGKQLFGSFTPQPASSTPNGFAALAVYDSPAKGGNGDGVIDANDAIFSSLRLWIDANHDGISQLNELYTLPSLNVESISLDYRAAQKKDRYGNVFRYRASVDYDDPSLPGGRIAYDVFLLPVTPPPPTITASNHTSSAVLKHGM